MKLFSDKYGLTVEQTERLFRDGIISYRPLRDAEIVEHFKEQLTFYQGRKMEAYFDTMFHYDVSMSTLQRALRRY